MINRLLLIIISYLISCLPLCAATYFVAKTGNDTTGNGSAISPWLTITKGVSMLHAGDTIWIKAGTYRETVTMDTAGTVDSPITLRAWPGDTVIINGADVITGWTQCEADATNLPGVTGDALANIWYKDVPYRATQLFQDGVRLSPSRYPTKSATTSPAHPFTDGGPGWCFPTRVDSTTVFYDTGLNTFADDYFNGSVCHIKGANSHERCINVSDFVQATGQVTLFHVSYTITMDLGYYFTHVAPQIDAEGEWAFKEGVGTASPGGRIYVYSNGTPTGTWEYSVRDGVEISANYNVVKDLTIQNAGMYGILLNNASNCMVNNCDINYTYYTAVYLYGSSGSNANQITYNTITYTGYYGVAQDEHATDTTISFNTITDTGVGSYNAGAQVAGAFGDDLTYHGFRLINYPGSTPTYENKYPGNGIFTAGEPGGAGHISHIDNNVINRCAFKGIFMLHRAHGGTISRNCIQNFCLAGYDGGGIYTQNAAKTAAGIHDEVTDNFVYNGYGYHGGQAGQDTTVPWEAYGLYLDNHTNDFDFRHNTVWHVYDSGIHLLWASDLAITDNTVYGCSRALYIQQQNLSTNDYVHDITFSNNLLFDTSASALSIFIRSYDDAAGWNNFGDSNNNYFLNPYAANNKHIRTFETDGSVTNTLMTLDTWKGLHNNDATSVDWTAFASAHPEVGYGTSRLVVNPAETTAVTMIDRQCIDIQGNPVRGSVSLTPYTSIVLVELKDQPTGYVLTVTTQNGTVTKSPNKASYNPGEIVTLTAIPAARYAFGGWQGAATGTTNPISITMNANTTVSASFTSMDPLLTEIKDKLVFGSVTSYQLIPTIGWAASQGSISMWANISSITTAQQYLFGHNIGTSTWDRIQLYLTDGNLCLGLGDSHTTRIHIELFQPQQWYNILLAWDNGNYSVYVNGMLKATGAYSGLTQLNTFADIGNNGGSRTEGFLGTIDDVRIYNRALTATEVRDVYYLSDGKENVLSRVSLLPYDISGNAVTFSPMVIGLPGRASFDPATNVLSWRPWYDQAGTYELLFSSLGSDYTQKVTINVEDVPLTTWYQDWIKDPNAQSAMADK